MLQFFYECLFSTFRLNCRAIIYIAYTINALGLYYLINPCTHTWYFWYIHLHSTVHVRPLRKHLHFLAATLGKFLATCCNSSKSSRTYLPRVILLGTSSVSRTLGIWLMNSCLIPYDSCLFGSALCMFLEDRPVWWDRDI